MYTYPGRYALSTRGGNKKSVFFSTCSTLELCGSLHPQVPNFRICTQKLKSGPIWPVLFVPVRFNNAQDIISVRTLRKHMQNRTL